MVSSSSPSVPLGVGYLYPHSIKRINVLRSRKAENPIGSSVTYPKGKTSYQVSYAPVERWAKSRRMLPQRVMPPRFRVRIPEQVDRSTQKDVFSSKVSRPSVGLEWSTYFRSLRMSSPSRNPVEVVDEAIEAMYTPLSSFKTPRGARTRVTFGSKRYRAANSLLKSPFKTTVKSRLAPSSSPILANLRLKQKTYLRSRR